LSKEDKNFYKSGNKKFGVGDYQGAIDDFTKAIELDPENPEIYIKRGDIKEVVLEDYQGAIDDFTKAIELDPKNPDRYIDRAELKIFSEDHQGVIDDYSKALELTTHEPDKKEILELRSKVYKILSKIDLDRSQSL